MYILWTFCYFNGCVYDKQEHYEAMVADRERCCDEADAERDMAEIRTASIGTDSLNKIINLYD